jgi:hypothetical protein
LSDGEQLKQYPSNKKDDFLIDRENISHPNQENFVLAG